MGPGLHSRVKCSTKCPVKTTTRISGEKEQLQRLAYRVSLLSLSLSLGQVTWQHTAESRDLATQSSPTWLGKTHQHHVTRPALSQTHVILLHSHINMSYTLQYRAHVLRALKLTTWLIYHVGREKAIRSGEDKCYQSFEKSHVSSPLSNQIGVMSHEVHWKLKCHVLLPRLCYMIIARPTWLVARVTCVASLRYPCSKFTRVTWSQSSKYSRSILQWVREQPDSKHSSQSAI